MSAFFPFDYSFNTVEPPPDLDALIEAFNPDDDQAALKLVADYKRYQRQVRQERSRRLKSRCARDQGEWVLGHRIEKLDLS